MVLLTTALGLTNPAYGWVLTTAVGAVLVNQWHSTYVFSWRKASGVKYPATYASDGQIESQKELPLEKQLYLRFNCAQRAHANYMETLPQFLVLLLIGGLGFPEYASVAGAIWLAGRVTYAVGYAKGEPKKRYNGMFFFIGLISLLVMTPISLYRIITGN
ncbi:hypothetical protein PYCC9005_005839 [Savitreella phatthalungensis]